MSNIINNVYINPSAAGATGIMAAVQLNQRAVALTRAGDHAGAEQLHRQALALKIQAAGAESIQAGLSRNALGEVLFRQGKLDEAEQELTEAVRIREAGGPVHGFDAAVSRENLAQVYEAKGQLTKARDVRKRKPDEMACGNYKVCIERGNKVVRF